MQSNNN